MVIMARRKSKNNNNAVWAVAAVAIVAILMMGMLVWTGHIDLSRFGFGEKIVITELEELEYEPPEKNCRDLDVTQEYIKAINNGGGDGDVWVQTFRTWCEVGKGGTYTGNRNELSCYWPPDPGNTICSSQNSKNSEEFCEDSLKAKYYCDEELAYIGCYCTGSLPDPWDADEQNGDVECGWHDMGVTGMVECYGSCPSQEECYNPAGTDICRCMNQGEISEWETDKRIVFVTDTTWNGAIGGIAGANNKCEVAAYYSGLGSNYIAIISDSSEDAEDNIPDGKYVRVDGVHVADNHADLFDGTLMNPININEKGETQTGRAWTGSNDAGQGAFHPACGDWSFVDANGMTGDISAVNGNWLEDSIITCGGGAHLYCVET